jgi:hypothetical protein
MTTNGHEMAASNREAAVYARDAWEAHEANLVDAQWTSLAQPGRDLLQVRT